MYLPFGDFDSDTRPGKLTRCAVEMTVKERSSATNELFLKATSKVRCLIGCGCIHLVRHKAIKKFHTYLAAGAIALKSAVWETITIQRPLRLAIRKLEYPARYGQSDPSRLRAPVIVQ